MGRQRPVPGLWQVTIGRYALLQFTYCCATIGVAIIIVFTNFSLLQMFREDCLLTIIRLL